MDEIKGKADERRRANLIHIVNNSTPLKQFDVLLSKNPWLCHFCLLINIYRDELTNIDKDMTPSAAYIITVCVLGHNLNFS